MITIYCAASDVTIDEANLNITDVKSLLGSSVIQQMFGIGDDMAAEVNGTFESSSFLIEDGDEIVLSTKAHDKGADAVVTIRNGVNEVQFDLESIGSTAAEILASQLVQMTFGTGDDMSLSLNGSPVLGDVEIADGDDIVLSTKAHDKGLLG